MGQRTKSSEGFTSFLNRLAAEIYYTWLSALLLPELFKFITTMKGDTFDHMFEI